MCALSIDAGKAGVPAPDAVEGPSRVPSHASVVVVGGGVIGCSVAYHLTKLGVRDVVLLERKALGCGTTWHSHGVVGLSRANGTLLRMALETVRMIPEVEAVSGKSTGYSARGSINVTEDPSRLIHFKRIADIARSQGLEAHVIDGAEAHALFPLMEPSGVIGALHLPTEGQCNPLDLTQALAAAARAGGARIVEGAKVTGATVVDARIQAVQTGETTITCETVVNCTGLWGRDFLRSETGGLPLQGVEHNYLVADFHPDVGPDLPLFRDPDKVMTLREDNGQFSVGFNEVDTNLFAADQVPEDFAFDELPPDWDAIMPYFEAAARRVPILNELGVRLFLCGPEAATPDTRYLLGPSSEIEGYYVAAGFSGIGIGSAGGAGRAIAEWIALGRPEQEPWGVDLRRMAPAQSNRNYLALRTREANGRLFPLAWPHRQNLTARNLRRSPLHPQMAAARACFIEDAGWEVPEWFAPEGVAPEPAYSFERPAWFAHARAEARAAQTGCAVADRSMTGKFLLVGDGLDRAFSDVFAVAAPHTGATDVVLRNSDGGIEALFTAIPQSRDRVLLLGDIGPQRRDLGGLTRAFGKAGGCSVVDMTSAFAAVEVIGPDARAALLDAGWRGDPEARFDPAAEIGHATCQALATDRFGLPAWLLIVPSESGAALLSALQDAATGLTPIGMHARHSLLTDAGTALWGFALSPSVTPREAGLDGTGPAGGRRLCRIVLNEPAPVLLGQEIIRIDGAVVGVVSQPAYALARDTAIGLAVINHPGLDRDIPCQVQIAGDWHKARISPARPDLTGAALPGTVPA